MNPVPFPSLPDDARVWCFGASRVPDGAETARLLDAVQTFVSEWTAHRRNLKAGFQWRNQRFLLVAVDESAAGASGCSIDALLRFLRDLGAEMGLDFLDSTILWYRDAAGRIRSCRREDFRELSRCGDVTGETPVFDLTVDRLAEVRAGRLEARAAESWHRTLLERS